MEGGKQRHIKEEGRQHSQNGEMHRQGHMVNYDTCLWAGHTEVVGETKAAVLHFDQSGTTTCGELGTSEFCR